MRAGTDSVPFRIAGNHPCLAGHFPGHPIVPAVVILDAVLSAARQRRPGLRVAELVYAKFKRPLPPATDATITLDCRERSLRFSVACADGELARGEFALAGDCEP